MFDKTINKILLKYLPSIEDRIIAAVEHKLEERNSALFNKLENALTCISVLQGTLNVANIKIDKLQEELAATQNQMPDLDSEIESKGILTHDNFEPDDFEVLTKNNFDAADFDLMVANDFSPGDYDLLTNDEDFVTMDQVEEKIAEVIKESDDVKAALGEVISETLKEAFCK